MSFEVKVLTNYQYPIIYLKDHSNNCEAEIYSFGGLLNSYTVSVNNNPFNIIDGFESIEDAVNNITTAFKGAKLSPFVCRMNHGKYQLNEQTYQVEKFYLQPHAIHGIIYDAVFSIFSTNADEINAEVVLQYQYNGSDKGYPFAYTMEITWRLEKNQQLRVSTKVNHSNNNAIPFADGWHPYFNLGKDGIDHCTIQFGSQHMFQFDDTLIPTGFIIEDLRFENETSLQNVQLDNCFLLNNEETANCILKNKQLQLTITPDNSYPYLQIYTPPHRQSIAIENLSAAPDAFNNKIGLLMIEPNKDYLFSTSYQVKKL
jgi:aldose 1-epimerase